MSILARRRIIGPFLWNGFDFSIIEKLGNKCCPFGERIVRRYSNGNFTGKEEGF
jgi:hypothetical protein